MTTSTFFVQPESSNNYFTYDSSYDLSQSTISPPGTYQKWDFTDFGYYCSLNTPKSGSGDVFTFLKTDGTNIFQSTTCDNACIWDAVYSDVTQINWYNLRHSQYLGVDTSTGQLALYSSMGTNTIWQNGSIVTWGDTFTNPVYVAIGSTNYYLVADMDGYTMTTSTTLDATNQCYQWVIDDSVPVQSLAPYFQSEYLTSDGDGTLSITGTQTFWTAIPLSLDNSVIALQSMNDGYLKFNSDGSTMSENITSPFLYAGAIGPECTLRITQTSFLNRDRKDRERRKKAAQERSLLRKSQSKVEEVNEETKETPKIEEVEETPKVEKYVEEKQTGSDFLEKLNKLEGIGFTNRSKNIEALIQTRADVKGAIKVLLDTN